MQSPDLQGLKCLLSHFLPFCDLAGTSETACRHQASPHPQSARPIALNAWRPSDGNRGPKTGAAYDESEEEEQSKLGTSKGLLLLLLNFSRLPGQFGTILSFLQLSIKIKTATSRLLHAFASFEISGSCRPSKSQREVCTNAEATLYSHLGKENWHADLPWMSTSVLEIAGCLLLRLY